MHEEIYIIKSYTKRRNAGNILLTILSFFIGITLDFYLYPDETITTAYIPLMIMTGILTRYNITNFIIAGITAILVNLASSEEQFNELFFLRWGGYFLISYFVKSLIERHVKDQENLIAFTSTLSSSIDARDSYTAFHSHNVAYYSREIGIAMKLPKKECNHLFIGGLLHDFGKIAVPESILNKTTKLTSTEYNLVKQHPQKGYDMLKHVPYFMKNSILDMVLYHHENFDGSGYPHGLSGENIPLVARIMAVADAFDAMTSKRAYRHSMGDEYALKEIENGKGRQFDPKIAEVFIELVKRGEITIKGSERDCFKDI